MIESNHIAKIGAELCAALRRLDADVELLSIVGSLGDTLDNATILDLLRDYNRRGTAFETKFIEVGEKADQ